ncbi:MAG: 16S rRNA (uracil(1498)-N(3))-methyltransferase [Eubacterium sp.]|nr:16S rRNA (uracil(1498)-N(3))-methyltransferase [Eubacterium sp.]
MNHFFAHAGSPDGDLWIRDPGDVKHIKNVLRMKTGEKISVSDTAAGRVYICRIEEFTPDGIRTAIEDINAQARELPVEITLFQGLPKKDKMDLIVQKAVELGAVRIVPVETRRTIVKLDRKKAEKKCARWNEIAKSAAGQSMRSVIPEVHMPVSFKEALAMASDLDMFLMPYENAKGMESARELVKEAAGKKSLGIMIGPEGGFAPEETEEAREAGAALMTLGHRILRTETAGMMVLSVLGFSMEED